MNTFADELRKRRGKLSQERAAEILGISVRALQNYEQGERLPPRARKLVTREMLIERLGLLDKYQPEDSAK